MRNLDLSIGQRLALGFGAAGVLIVFLIAGVHLASERVAAVRYRQTEIIAPRAEAAARLEADVLSMAITSRSYLLAPSPEKRQAYERAVEQVKGELATLLALPLEPDGKAIIEPVGRLVERYQREIGVQFENVAGLRSGAAQPETSIRDTREALLAAVREFGALQTKKVAATRAEIAAALNDVERLAWGLGLLIVALLTLTGFLTSRSVRGQAHALVLVSRRMATGDFEPAAALAQPAEASPPRDELAELSRAFGRMAVELRERDQRLQEKNEALQAQQEELQAQSEEIQAQNEELQSQNEELQAQGDQLLAQSEMLRDADRHKNEFLAMLSHELRNPLAPIKNSLYIMSRAAPGSEQAQRAQDIIARQVNQLTRLVDDLLDLTRISHGKVQLKRKGVDLAKLLRQVAEDHAAEFGAREISFSYEAASGPVVVDGDEPRIAQVVGNLLQNAAKFTPAGGQVRMLLETANGRALIRVCDTGAGMDESTLNRLFQPFMQADVTLARTSGGLGLGLALTKGLIEMHGGRVRAASAGRNQGAEFVVELPISDKPLVEDQPRSAPPRRPLRVLVVEDNVDAADTLREAIEFGTHTVAVAYTAKAGVEKALVWRPDVLICDIGLPDMDGIQVARAFRADPLLRSIYLVALSGYAQPEDRARSKEAGFDAHLAKPPRLEAIEELLASIPPREPEPSVEAS